MQYINYSFTVNINQLSNIIGEGGLFDLALNNCVDIIIKSKLFNTFNECSESLSKLMSTISSYESYLSDTAQDVYTVLNPNTGGEIVDSSWESTTILRIYVASERAPGEHSAVGEISAAQNVAYIQQPKQSYH